jgi:hypothetical protein
MDFLKYYNDFSPDEARQFKDELVQGPVFKGPSERSVLPTKTGCTRKHYSNMVQRPVFLWQLILTWLGGLRV